MNEELQEFGLSKNEALLYTISLKTGEATANRIAELAHLARSTTYDVLDRLKAQGLVSTCIIQSTMHYIAADPEVLLTQLDEKRASINHILPKLKKIHKQVGEKPVAEVFQGKIAIVKLLDEILDNAKSLKVIGSQGNALEKIGYHPERFREKRLKRKITIKQILEWSKESKTIPKDKYTQIRFLHSLGSSAEATFIYGEYVYHIILQYEISAIKIKSKDHAQAHEILFDELWKKATV